MIISVDGLVMGGFVLEMKGYGGITKGAKFTNC